MSKKKRKGPKVTVPDLPAVSFDVLTISFTDRTVEYRGRTVSVDANCLTIPLLSDQVPHVRTGWFPMAPPKATAS